MRIITEKHGCCTGEGQGSLKACSHSQEQEEVEPKFSIGRRGGGKKGVQCRKDVLSDEKEGGAVCLGSIKGLSKITKKERVRASGGGGQEETMTHSKLHILGLG